MDNNQAVTAFNLQNKSAIKKRKKLSFRMLYKDFLKNRLLLFLTLPTVIYTFIFSYIPMFGIVLAFKNLNYSKGFWKSDWVGFQNFELLFKSPDAFRITRNTLGYNGIFIVLNLIFAVFVALLLYELTSKWLLKIYQTVMFIPHFLSWVVVAYMAYAFLNPRAGILNQLLTGIGVDVIDWYSTPLKWVFIFPAAEIWKGIGMGALVYYASLLSIDAEYFEAAEIEGASKFVITTKITLPFLYPLMIILTILAIGKIFNADFGLFYQLPMDSPMLRSTTDVIDTYVYRALIETGNVGVSTAVGLYRSVVGFVLVLATNAIVKKIDPEYSLF